ncbi:cag pathogenicity island protein Cag7 [Wenjunlia vitaminophila]|uniref:Cag pathogenicity island protein Cag7 n=1 Tax=Wenjunlia vitaminophila TaxID=76728 RepID=A0A0T6LYR8_WENVI|nr:protein kinase [Wenjunlia vitaminophila]KRV50879.1 cag pathogenicity island protein Cag7 [Wenjunlia vitaminophila]
MNWGQHQSGQQTAQPGAGRGVPGQGRGTPAPVLPDGYQLLRPVGAGRYASVYLCREEATGNEVAVKVTRFAVRSSSKRLAGHAELLAAGAAARHPCAVRVEDAGFTSERRAYLVTQFCRGGNAAAKLAASGPFPVEEVLAIGVRLALALHSSHRAGVLHLDVRPANVLYDEAGDSLLSDNGVARVFQRCAPELGVVFDPMYVSREMFGWETPGPAADVYGLGATLFALLAGEPAYSDAGRNGWAALYQEVLRGELPYPHRPDVPPQLMTMIQRMMSAQPENRPPLTEVHRVLRQMLPVAYASRVPDLEPEPAVELPLPGWDPADDITLEEVEENERAKSEAQAAIRRRNRNRVLTATSVVVLFAAAATALVLFTGGDDEKKPSKNTASPSQKQTQGQTEGGTGEQDPAQGQAQQVPAEDLPDLQPKGLSVATQGNSVQVSWQAPQKPESVAYYLVTASPPGDEGQVLSIKQAAKDEFQVVFTKPPVTADSCYTVTAMVGTDANDLKFAPSESACADEDGQDAQAESSGGQDDSAGQVSGGTSGTTTEGTG